MTSDRLESLVETGLLVREEPSETELEGLMASGTARLEDAQREDLSAESRFDLAYNAAFALARYALRRKGYRPKKRYVVFQVLTETAGLDRSRWRVLDKAHSLRNRVEYEGYPEVDDSLLTATIQAARELLISLEGEA